VLAEATGGPPLAGQAIAIAGGRIAAIGPAATVSRQWRAARVIDGAGGTAIPGLVDAHAHPGFVVGADWTASGSAMSSKHGPMARGGDIAMMLAIFVAIFDGDVPADVVQPLAELTYAAAALQGQSAMVDAGSLDPQAVATAARRVGVRTRVSVCGFDLGPDPLEPAGRPVPRRDTDRLLAELDGHLARLDAAGVPAAVNGFWPMLCSDALLDGLRQLEADTHVHVHKENAVLFPSAAQLEAKRR
jgi:cytosine/adenosine deaminase-related metal-dependent hydrolase